MEHAFVFVIESPSADDLMDGRTEGRSLCAALQLADVPQAYCLVANKEMLVKSLEVNLRREAARHNKVPMLHFSMHGSSDGVWLTSGEIVTWEDLRHLLRNVLVATGGTLLVTMSSCFGTAGCRMAMHDDSEPTFWALVGHTDQPTWADAAVAYITFYHLLFKERNIRDCVDAMNVAAGTVGFMCLLGSEAKAAWTATQAHHLCERLGIGVLTGTVPTSPSGLLQPSHTRDLGA